MIKTVKQKTKPTQTELPPGWKWHYRDSRVPSYVAERPGDGLCSPGFPTEAAAAHWAQMKDEADREDSVIAEVPTLEQALKAALHSVQGAEERWRPLINNGATDAELMEAIGEAFGICDEWTINERYSCKGGHRAEFVYPTESGVKSFRGKRLLAKVREVMEIGAPGAASCPNCGYPVEKGHVCDPGKSPKPLVDPSIVCVCGHKADAHAPFNSPDEPPQECVECKCDQFKPANQADADPVRLHEEALARWRREKLPEESPAANGYHPQMLRMIPLDQIEPSPTNPRKYFDQVKLQELANSIIEHGLVEPILVRPLRRTTTGALIGGDIGETLNAWPGLASNLYYQLVAGERRYRAVKLAGLTKIEAKVRDLDDKSVLEIQFIENLQRTDLSPIEEAEGYKRLLDEHGYTADSLAGKLGKSKSYVYARLKICNLPEAAMEAMAKGELPATIGELIGRLPSMEMREKFWSMNFGSYGQKWFHVPSYRSVKETIESNYMKELKGAPFDQKDAKLLPEAGSCAKCPKRTGNNKVEYPGARADVCTDTGCFELKVQAFNKRTLDEAAGEGVKILSEKEAKEFFPYSYLDYSKRAEYIDLENECEEAVERPDNDDDNDDFDTPAPTFQSLIGDSVKPAVVGLDRQGNVHRLVSRAAAVEALREKGIELDPPPKSHGSSDHKSDQAAQRKKMEIRKEVAREALGFVSEKASRWIHDAPASDRDEMMRLILNTICGDTWSDVVKLVARRRGVTPDPRRSHALAGLIAEMDSGETIGLLTELALARQMLGWSTGGYLSDLGPRAKELLKFFDFDLKATEKRIKDQKAAEKKAKMKPKPKAKAAAEG